MLVPARLAPTSILLLAFAPAAPAGVRVVDG